MFSLFPELLFLAPFSALMLRATLATVLAVSAWHHAGTSDTRLRIIGIAEAGVALALALGAQAQGAALAAGAILVLELAVPRSRALPPSTLWLSLIIALSVFITGAGAIAFDLPL
ncbi:hypothetical protein FJY94_01910 [Candidatus Kaiserbacteria bacterium]|nr:hypothetical protein [Candidatus Kaiserbacteria bacterium]